MTTQCRSPDEPLVPLIDQLRFNEAVDSAVAQDRLDGAVLMVAWMNRESILHTLNSGEAHHWSRSRRAVAQGCHQWTHPEVREIRYDCDADVLLLSIEQIGDVACHTGARSCFRTGRQAFRWRRGCTSPPADVCTEFYRVIEGRRLQPEQGSYTNKLFEGGDNRSSKDR